LKSAPVLFVVSFELLHRVMNYHKRNVDAPTSAALDPLKSSTKRRAQLAISYRVIAPIAMICDALLILLMSVLADMAYHYDNINAPSADVLQWTGLAAIVATLFIALGKSDNLYDPPELLNLKAQIGQILVRWISVLLLLSGVATCALAHRSKIAA